MKAAILEKYNKNGAKLKIKEIPIPEIGNDEVLKKVASGGSRGKTIIKI